MFVSKNIKLFGLFGLGLLGFLGVIIFSAPKAHAATYTVTSTDDAGANTLRQAITDANGNAGADTINFNIAGAGVHTITLASDLPEITETVTIDGTSQTGASCGTLVLSSLPADSNTAHTLLIEIDVAGVTSSAISIGATNVTIKGLVINGDGSASNMIYSSQTGTTIECNYIGTNSAGTADASAATATGVSMDASGTVQNNLISGNDLALSITGATAQNNLIGTTASGLAAIPNTNGLIISTDSTLTHNIIAGNGSGITATGSFTISGNYIGLNLSGGTLGNGEYGIYVPRGSANYTIGGTTDSSRNVISANSGSGVHLETVTGSGCPSNTNSTVQGNYIGTNPSGSVQSGFGNSASGITANESRGGGCGESVYKHVIGGLASGESNTIAGNAQDGIRIYSVPWEQCDDGEGGTYPCNGTDVFSVTVLANRIFSNGNLGINLASDDNNDGLADADLGPNPINALLMNYPAQKANYYLNHPTIDSSTSSGSQVTVTYDFQANGVENTSDGYSLRSDNLVGYQLDFYINDSSTDGAYSGYGQGQTHLGSFIVDGSENNATHTFTSPIALTGSQYITATATVLWEYIAQPGSDCPATQYGTGPPYSITSCGL